MGVRDTLAGILVAATVCALFVLFAAFVILFIVLSFYVSAYTVALFHILFIEPAIFDTHSLFTIPYNEIYAMAQTHPIFYWVVAGVYMVGFLEGVFGDHLKG